MVIFHSYVTNYQRVKHLNGQPHEGCTIFMVIFCDLLGAASQLVNR